VQTRFVLLTIEVRPPKLENGPVVHPQEEAHRALDQIRHEDESPEFWPEYVLRGEFLLGNQ
jgi:hypothetical protein